MPSSTLVSDFNDLTFRLRAAEQEILTLRRENEALRKDIKVRHNMLLARDDQLRGLAGRVKKVEKMAKRL